VCGCEANRHAISSASTSVAASLSRFVQTTSVRPVQLSLYYSGWNSGLCADHGAPALWAYDPSFSCICVDSANPLPHQPEASSSASSLRGLSSNGHRLSDESAPRLSVLYLMIGSCQSNIERCQIRRNRAKPSMMRSARRAVPVFSGRRAKAALRGIRSTIISQRGWGLFPATQGFSRNFRYRYSGSSLLTLLYWSFFYGNTSKSPAMSEKCPPLWNSLRSDRSPLWAMGHCYHL